ncbi:hypothetical protein Tco_0326767, partial [Tanacetum coccineum]
MHLAWPLWSDLRVIPTHGKFCSLKTTSVGNNSVFRSFFEKQKLTGPNFIDWYRQLWLVLSTEDKEKYLEQPIPAAPIAVAPDQPISPQALATYNDLILVGLSKEYDSFVQNYNMHNMGKTVNELHAMHKLHEETLPKKVVAHALHAIRAEKVQKNKNRKPSEATKGLQGKGKGK